MVSLGHAPYTRIHFPWAVARSRRGICVCCYLRCAGICTLYHSMHFATLGGWRSRPINEVIRACAYPLVSDLSDRRRCLRERAAWRCREKQGPSQKLGATPTGEARATHDSGDRVVGAPATRSRSVRGWPATMIGTRRCHRFRLAQSLCLCSDVNGGEPIFAVMPGGRRTTHLLDARSRATTSTALHVSYTSRRARAQGGGSQPPPCSPLLRPCRCMSPRRHRWYFAGAADAHVRRLGPFSPILSWIGTRAALTAGSTRRTRPLVSSTSPPPSAGPPPRLRRLRWPSGAFLPRQRPRPGSSTTFVPWSTAHSRCGL
jgi:hypothetical protein